MSTYAFAGGCGRRPPEASLRRIPPTIKRAKSSTPVSRLSYSGRFWLIG